MVAFDISSDLHFLNSSPSAVVQQSSPSPSSPIFFRLDNNSRIVLHPEAIVLINSSLHDSHFTQSLGVYGSYVGILVSLIAILIIIWSCYHCFCHGREEKASRVSELPSPTGDSPPPRHAFRYSNGRVNNEDFRSSLEESCRENSIFKPQALRHLSANSLFPGSQPFSYTKPQSEFFAVYRSDQSRYSGQLDDSIPTLPR